LEKIRDYKRSWVSYENRTPLKKLPLIINNTHQKLPRMVNNAQQRLKGPGKTIEEISGNVRPQRVIK